MYTTAASIDGFIADNEYSIDWLLAVDHGGGALDRVNEFFAGVGAICMGVDRGVPGELTGSGFCALPSVLGTRFGDGRRPGT
ncbi:hypothetical protein [Haloglycomyces albus]|uniref:hypothetical protein n=1 Tax=Haloglycomyces albus TaxID=526067 RepID=UPI0004B48071|nr:hypothetical protein [Haloglycomyces albus]